MINTQSIKDIMKEMLKIIPSRSTMPILKTIKLETNGNTLALTGGNMEMSLTRIIENDCTPFSVCVNARKFNDIVNTINKDEFDLQIAKDKLVIKHGRSRSRMHFFNGDEFPMLNLDHGSAFDVEGYTFFDAIKKVLFCAKKDDDLAVTSGVLVKSKADGTLLVGATDSFKMAMIKLMLGLPEFEVVIPHSAATLLSMQTNSNIKMTVNGNQIKIFNHEFIFTSQILSGNYPQIEALISNFSGNNNIVIEVEKKKLSNALKQILVFAKDNDCYTEFAIENDELQISSRSMDGESVAHTELLNHSGENIKFSADGRLIYSAVKASDSSIILGIKDAIAPMEIKIPENETFIYLFAPMETR